MLKKLYKTTQFPLLFAKLAIVTLAFWFIFSKLFENAQDSLKFWADAVSHEQIPVLLWISLILLSVGNWFFEIKKWQLLASQIKPISFTEAVNQTLSSFTASVFTPNRIGEYGAKSLFFEKKDWKKIVFLNFVGNITQLTVTVFFGLLGLLILYKFIELPFSNSKIFMVGGLLLLIPAVLLFFRNKKLNIKGYSLEKLKEYFRNINARTKFNLVSFSTLRYLLFSHQFYLFLMIFGADLNYFEAISAIFVVYLFASALPSIFVLEAVVKGSVALWVFSFFQIEEMVVLSSVGFMWLFNFGIPAILGSYFVLQFQPQKRMTA